MNRFISAVRKPVKRLRAEQNILITLLSFAASVSLTRLFLQVTGYPQLGGGELHIAHLLWGGLFLFIATLLLLILSNRWVFTLGAALAGVGVGLFIDEVGKFITQSNDYFYPPAAPIIYVFFLLIVLLYLRVRKPPIKDARSELYYVLDGFGEVLDNDLDTGEKAEIVVRLQYVASQADQPDLAHIAQELLQLLESNEIKVVPNLPTFIERFQTWLDNLQRRILNPVRSRLALSIGIGILSLIALYRLGQLLGFTLSPEYLANSIDKMTQAGLIHNLGGFYWFVARALLEGLTGALLLTSAILLVNRKEHHGINLSYWGLLLSLTTIDLLIFYFDQFSTIIMAIAQFMLLMGVIQYKRLYLSPAGLLEGKKNNTNATNK